MSQSKSKSRKGRERVAMGEPDSKKGKKREKSMSDEIIINKS